MKKHLLFAALLGLLLAILTACGGGGGGSRTPVLNNPGGNDQQPATFNPVEVSIPQVAESGGELGGIVADFVGTPVPDLEVYLDSATNVVSTTDENGNFLAADVSSGDHTISIGVEGIQVASYAVTYDASMPMNLAISPASLRNVSSDLNYGRLEGHVSNAAGENLQGVHILLFNNEQYFMLRGTNADGFYDFSQVPVGNYSLIGYKRGYRMHVGSVAITSGGTTVHDFVMEGMPIGRVIGVVRNEEEQPIARTHVFLMYRDHEDSREPPAFHTLTNQHGEYAFADVPAGAADMLAYHPEFEPADSEVAVPPQGQVIQNFILRHNAPPPPPPPDYGTLSGIVFNGENQPIGGATIVLEREDLRFTAESNQEGYYQFGELPVGPFVFNVSAEGYEPVRGQLAIIPGQNCKNFFLGVNPPPGGTVCGIVLWGDTQEVVVGARVEVWVPGQDGTMQKIREGESNENGQFGFAEIPPGPGAIKAFKNEAAGAVDYQLEPGGNVTVTIPIFAQQQWSGKICGRTKMGNPDDPNGYVLVPGTDVKLFRGEPGPNNPPIASTISDVDAYYEFAGLAPTGDGPKYWVVGRKDIDSGIVVEGRACTFLGENEVVELHIFMAPVGPPPPMTSKIHGKVVMGNTDPPAGVVGACVRLFHGLPSPNNPPMRTTASGDGGYYAFPELPPSGDLSYFVFASKIIENIEYVGQVETGLAENEIKIIDVPIFQAQPPPAGMLYGRVWRPDPENLGSVIPVPGATVRVFHGDPNQPPLYTVTTGPEGWYEIRDIPPSGNQPYGIVADIWINEVHFIGDGSALVPPGESVQKDILIQAQGPPPPTGGAIHGLIRRQNPEDPNLPPISVPGATVKLYHGQPGPDNPPIRELLSNDLGQYLFDGLGPSGDIPYIAVSEKIILEVLWVGSSETYLEQGQNVELHIMMWPPV
jgi:hypothetical protein